jgi:hypothetical protein
MNAAIISTPIDFPLVQPRDWNEWNSVWNKNAKFAKKLFQNHNESQAYWKGFDIYVDPTFNAVKDYDFTNINCPELFPCIFDNLDRLPIDVKIVRAFSSLIKTTPHQDFDTPTVSVRTLLAYSNPKHTFYYKFNGKQEYQQLPSSTNTWVYWDNKSYHGTDFNQGFSKILIAYYGDPKPIEFVDEVFLSNANLYPEYVIHD